MILGLSMSAYIARMARSSFLEVMREDYVRTARSKGLNERIVLWVHVLRNAILPVITVSGVMLGFVLGGAVAIETVFVVPGLGTALVDAVNERDFTVIQNLVLLFGVVFVILNLAIDVLYAWIDPRIRLA